MSGPAISVVVATFDRARLLPWLFAGFDDQGDDDFEVVVIDDASRDDTPAVLADLAAAAPYPVRLIRLAQNAGPSVARNAGWRAAAAPVIAFTDDDCRPRPGWLAALRRAMSDAEVAQGRVVPDPDAPDPHPPWSHTVDISERTGSYETCNIAYRRDLLERLGGFDERYRIAEDIDLGYRAMRAGARFRFVDDAVVVHEVAQPSYHRRLRSALRLEDLVRATREYPEFRPKLAWGIFFSPSHPRALLAAAGAVALFGGRPSSGRLAAAASLGLPYVWFRAFVRPIPGRKYTWPLVMPQALAADLLEIAVLARWSLRYRTVVL